MTSAIDLPQQGRCLVSLASCFSMGRHLKFRFERFSRLWESPRTESLARPRTLASARVPARRYGVLRQPRLGLAHGASRDSRFHPRAPFPLRGGDSLGCPRFDCAQLDRPDARSTVVPAHVSQAKDKPVDPTSPWGLHLIKCALLNNWEFRREGTPVQARDVRLRCNQRGSNWECSKNWKDWQVEIALRCFVKEEDTKRGPRPMADSLLVDVETIDSPIRGSRPDAATFLLRTNRLPSTEEMSAEERAARAAHRVPGPVQRHVVESSTRIGREFDGNLYHGLVVAVRWDPDEEDWLYWVRFDDGDNFEYNMREVLDGVRLAEPALKEETARKEQSSASARGAGPRNGGAGPRNGGAGPSKSSKASAAAKVTKPAKPAKVAKEVTKVAKVAAKPAKPTKGAKAAEDKSRGNIDICNAKVKARKDNLAKARAVHSANCERERIAKAAAAARAGPSSSSAKKVAGKKARAPSPPPAAAPARGRRKNSEAVPPPSPPAPEHANPLGGVVRDLSSSSLPRLERGETEVLSHVLSPEVTKKFREAQAAHLRGGDASTSWARILSDTSEGFEHAPLRGMDIQAALLERFAASSDYARPKAKHPPQLPRDLPYSDRVEMYTVPDDDPRVALRGQLGVRVRRDARTIKARTVLGPYAAYVCNMTEHESHKFEPLRGVPLLPRGKRRILQTQELEGLHLQFEVEFCNTLDLDVLEGYKLFVDAYGYGGFAAAVNDPVIDPFAPCAKGFAPSEVDEPNVALTEVLIRGFPFMLHVATRDIHPGQELLTRYGGWGGHQGYWSSQRVMQMRIDNLRTQLGLDHDAAPLGGDSAAPSSQPTQGWSPFVMEDGDASERRPVAKTSLRPPDIEVVEMDEIDAAWEAEMANDAWEEEERADAAAAGDKLVDRVVAKAETRPADEADDEEDFEEDLDEDEDPSDPRGSVEVVKSEADRGEADEGEREGAGNDDGAAFAIDLTLDSDSDDAGAEASAPPRKSTKTTTTTKVTEGSTPVVARLTGYAARLFGTQKRAREESEEEDAAAAGAAAAAAGAARAGRESRRRSVLSMDDVAVEGGTGILRTGGKTVALSNSDLMMTTLSG